MRPALARFVETLPAVFAVGTVAVVALLAVLGFGSLVPVAAVVGWLLLTPLSAFLVYVLGVTDDGETADAVTESVGENVSEAGRTALSSSNTDDRTEAADDDPLATLRDRYARGEIDEVEFERRLERLLETEDVELPPGATLDSDVIDRETDEPAILRETDEPATEREAARER